MKKIFLALSVALALCLIIGTVSADSIGGGDWKYSDSQYERLSDAWINDVQTHIHDVIYDPSLSLDERLMAQVYMLGWDDRFDYVDQYGVWGQDDNENDSITYTVPAGDDWFTNMTQYNELMQIYNENFCACVQSVPREV